MAWIDDISEAAYTAPSGKRLAFNYDSALERTTPLKTAENTFPDLDGAEVQSLGLGGKKFPMTAIFSGADCMKDADAFEALVCERGYGVLEHPVYGKHTVVPTGEIGRSDDLVEGVSESRVKVTFTETISDRTFPDSEVSAEDALDSAVQSYEESAADEFSNLIETDSVDDKIQLQSELRTQGGVFFKGTEKIAAASPDVDEKRVVLKDMTASRESFSLSIDKIEQIAANALEIARTVIRAAWLPSVIGEGLLEKVDMYGSVINDIISGAKSALEGAGALSNRYAVVSTMTGSLIAACASGTAKTAARSGGFTSRADVLLAVDSLTALFDTYTEYMDSVTAENAFVDTGGGYSELLEIVITSVQLLQVKAFELPVIRTVRLGRDRQLIELLCEFYGMEAFDHLDQFILDNELTADELTVIPMGREVFYYG